jgi:nitrite reductase/ring-hydroxylating ferredoxin subunit
MSEEMAPIPLSARNLWLHRSAAELGAGDLHRRIVDEIIDGVRALKGDPAAQLVSDRGLELLHTVVDSTDLGRLRDRVLEAMRPDLLKMAVVVGRNLLHWSGEFYVDDYLILRINFPYEVARKADPKGENPGIGRVSPSIRPIAQARRPVDPVYDPKSYHKDHPPAAWAHGPHKDSWAGHSMDGLNIWWAMCDTPAEASMVLYPELMGKEAPRDPRTLYVGRGYALPKPTLLPLSGGDMLIFDPEILHGTHLNVSSRTRVAVSLRLNARRPSFSPDCFYAREFWRKASDIEAGRYDAILHLKREDNLDPPSPPKPIDWPERPKTIQIAAGKNREPISVGPVSLIGEGERLVVETDDRRILVHRRGGALFAVDARCPHYGVDLSDGAADHEKLFCPGCGVGFDIATGVSAAPSLTLRRISVSEDNGIIMLSNMDA